MTSGAPLSGVGETALGAAMMRAEESARSDRLFDDVYASAFVAAAPMAFADGPDPGDPTIAALRDAFCAHVAVRTRFYDDFLLSAGRHGCRQVVLLAAGLDARAFRLDWPPGTRLFELDLPGVLSFKDAVLAEQGAVARCPRSVVSVDLRDDWATMLARAGFAADVPTAWTAEGLLTYLSDREATLLLARVSALAVPGSRLALEAASVADDSTLTDARDVAELGAVSTLWQGGMRDDAADWLEAEGWRVERHDRAALAKAYNRLTSDESSGGFLTALMPPR